MSRLGRQPIPIPEGVSIELKPGAVAVKGPKGSLNLVLPSAVSVEQQGAQLIVKVGNPDEKRQRAVWGLSRVLVSNMITGVTKGFEKSLEIQGVGFRAEVKGSTLTLTLGFSHPVVFPIPAGIEIAVEKNTVRVKGVDKQLVGEVAAQIRRFRPPEPYKGTGIRYTNEVVRRKAGKAVKAVGAK